MTTSDCIIWTRARNNRGYGVVWRDGKVRLAHRVAWFDRYGRWPTDGLVLDHICNVKACVNVDHLREVTNRENILRSPRSPMNTIRASALCRNGHPYDDRTVVDRNGWRVCAECADRRRRAAS